MNEETLQHLAAQFRCPSGKDGLKTGERMFETNRSITELSVRALHPAKNDVVLEIGMGVARQADFILQAAEDVRYWGVEISPLMLEKACVIHHQKIEHGQVAFYLSDGNTLPLADASCNKIFTVNTVYFWEKPVEYLNEIHRVLNDNGLFCLTFASDNFMSKLPFSNYGFRLYNQAEIIELFCLSKFTITDIHSVIEPDVYHVNGRADREVFFVIACK